MNAVVKKSDEIGRDQKIATPITRIHEAQGPLVDWLEKKFQSLDEERQKRFRLLTQVSQKVRNLPLLDVYAAMTNGLILVNRYSETSEVVVRVKRDDKPIFFWNDFCQEVKRKKSERSCVMVIGIFDDSGFIFEHQIEPTRREGKLSERLANFGVRSEDLI